MLRFGQFGIFVEALAIGLSGGVFHDLLSGVVATLKNVKREGLAWAIYEVAFFLSYGAAFVALQAILGFSELRGYIFGGIFVGFWGYYKNLRIIVAFFKKVCYNIATKTFRKRKKLSKKR